MMERDMTVMEMCHLQDTPALEAQAKNTETMKVWILQNDIPVVAMESKLPCRYEVLPKHPHLAVSRKLIWEQLHPLPKKL
jgi:hypothetical protein